MANLPIREHPDPDSVDPPMMVRSVDMFGIPMAILSHHVDADTMMDFITSYLHFSTLLIERLRIKQQQFLAAGADVQEPVIPAGGNGIVVEPVIPAGPEIAGDEGPLDADMLMARITSFIEASTQLLQGLKSDQLRFQEPPENNEDPVVGNNDKKKRKKKKKKLLQGHDHGYFINTAIRASFVIIGFIAVGVAMWLGFGKPTTFFT